MAVVLALASTLVAPKAHADNPGVEYAVKANYLYKFAPFVAWPPRAFPAAGAPFNVCIFGDDPFGSALDQAVRGQTVEGHPVAVRRLKSVAGEPNCQVLYVGRSRSQSPAEVLRMLQGLPVLTVTDAGQGVDGGIVHFILRDGRVRFALDVAQAQASGLGISSKLQGLAVSLRAGG